MTKKKRELIDILLDNITPDDWPKKAVYAAQDKATRTCGKNALMFYTNWELPHVTEGGKSFTGEKIGDEIILPELCRNWNKTIVHRDEFMKRWDERNPVVDSEGWIQWNGEEIPCRFVDEKSPLSTQIGGNHYTKLAIQPMRYSMENGLDALQHTVIKYVTRFRDKNGIEDLEKAKHCIDMLIEYERGKK